MPEAPFSTKIARSDLTLRSTSILVCSEEPIASFYIAYMKHPSCEDRLSTSQNPAMFQ